MVLSKFQAFQIWWVFDFKLWHMVQGTNIKLDKFISWQVKCLQIGQGLTKFHWQIWNFVVSKVQVFKDGPKCLKNKINRYMKWGTAHWAFFYTMTQKAKNKSNKIPRNFSMYLIQLWPRNHPYITSSKVSVVGSTKGPVLLTYSTVFCLLVYASIVRGWVRNIQSHFDVIYGWSPSSCTTADATIWGYKMLLAFEGMKHTF